MFEDAEAQAKLHADRAREVADSAAKTERDRQESEMSAAREFVDAMQRLGIVPQTHDFLATGSLRAKYPKSTYTNTHSYFVRTGKTVLGWSVDDPTRAIRGPGEREARSLVKTTVKKSLVPDPKNALGFLHGIVITPNGLACLLTPEDGTLGHGYLSGGPSHQVIEPWRFRFQRSSFGGGGIAELSDLLRTSLADVFSRRSN